MLISPRRNIPLTATLPIPTLTPEVQSQLCQLAFQVFTSKPGEGDTRTGSLLGKNGPNGPEIIGFSERIEPQSIGQWSIHRRLPKAPASSGLHIAIAPVTVTRATALIWTGDGPTPTSLTFRSETHPAPKRTPPPEKKQIYNWWPVLTATLCLLLAASFWPVSASVEEDPLPRVTLNLQSTKGALRLHWQESGPRQASALQSATVTVNQETIDLFDHYQANGELTLRPKSKQLVVTLRVRRANRPLLQQTITYIDPRKGLN